MGQSNNKGKETEMTHYKAPGEHEVDGVKYFAEIPPDGLDKIRNMSLHDDDVIIASYPKCGKSLRAVHFQFLEEPDTIMV